MKKIGLFSIVLLSLSSCTLTGDPTQGGIFWSPSKAAERQTALLEEQRSKQLKVTALENTSSILTIRKKRLRSELDALKAQKESAAADVDVSDIDAEIRAIELELSNM